MPEHPTTGTVVAIGPHSTTGGHIWRVETDAPPPRDVIWLTDRQILAKNLDVGDRVSLTSAGKGRHKYLEATPLAKE